MDFKENHFRLIFWFCAALTVIILAYDFGITFLEIPEKSVRFADSHSSSFNNILIAIVSFFTGAAVGTITKSKKNTNENDTEQSDAQTHRDAGRD